MRQFPFTPCTKISSCDAELAQMLVLCLDKGVRPEALLNKALIHLSDFLRVHLDLLYPIKFVIAVAIYSSFCEILQAESSLSFGCKTNHWPEINAVGRVLSSYLKETESALSDIDIVQIRYYLHYFAGPPHDTRFGPRVRELISKASAISLDDDNQ